MKNMFLIFVCFIGISMDGRAQYHVDTSGIQPYTFEETISPYLLYKQAYERAEEIMMGYFEKADAAIERGRYSLAITYLKKCSELNKRFKGNLYPQKDLDKWIQACEEAEKKQQQQYNQNR